MKSLSDLNSLSSTSLTVTDSRPASVTFDRVGLAPLDQVLTINSTTINVTPGINITEVINYETANCQLIVTIVTGTPALTGSSV